MATLPSAGGGERKERASEPARVLSFDGGAGGGGAAAVVNTDYATLGVGLSLVPVSMFFLAFVSAFVVRQGLSSDWQAVELPGVLWLNTLVLLASSVTLHRGGAV